MRAVKIELVVVDFEGYGEKSIADMVSAHRDLLTAVLSTESADIGDWSDDHPLNHDSSQLDAARAYFPSIERAVLAKAGEQEPIYMWRLEDDGWMECTKEFFDADISSGYEKRIVYADPLPAQAIPEGWQLVPIEPTYNMLIEKGCKSHLEGEQCHHHDRRKRIWESMLSASPKP